MKLFKMLPEFFMQVLMLIFMSPFLIFGVLVNLICVGFTAGFEFSNNYGDRVSQRRIDAKAGKGSSHVSVR